MKKAQLEAMVLGAAAAARGTEGDEKEEEEEERRTGARTVCSWPWPTVASANSSGA